MHELYEKAKRIKDQIKVYTSGRKDQYWKETEPMQIENRWGASYLLAKILYKSSFREYSIINKDLLKSIYKEYHQKTGNEINLDGLLKKSWLRNIGNKIFISGGIRHLLHDVPKVIELKNELNILSKLSSENKS